MDAYGWLMKGAGAGDAFDRHVFACALAIALDDPERTPAAALGLAAADLALLVGRYFPHAPGLAAGDGAAPVALEEADLRDLLLEGRGAASPEGTWLAHIVARRALEPNHLWQDLGLTGRADLGRLMQRHFGPLAARNSRDMKWKKFFYRELCQREGLTLCKSPSCDACTDFTQCFGAEDGISLLARAARQSLPPLSRPNDGGSPC